MLNNTNFNKNSEPRKKFYEPRKIFSEPPRIFLKPLKNTDFKKAMLLHFARQAIIKNFLIISGLFFYRKWVGTTAARHTVKTKFTPC